MLDLVDANQQPNNADLPSDFEFVMPILPHHDNFPKPDGTETSPADELFFRGQLLPLLLPCRLKMVQDLYDFNPEQNVLSSEDANAPCTDAPCAKGPSVRIADVLLSHHEERMPCTQKQRSYPVSVAVSKPRLKWKLIFRRAKRCSVTEATHCAQAVRSTNDNTSKIERSNARVCCCSSVLRSGSYKGDSILIPKIVRRVSSSLSSASMCRNPSKNSRASAKRVQKGSLMLKAKDCLQKSIKVFKLGRFVEQGNHQQRASLLKRHDSGYCVQNTTLSGSVTKNRRQVAHCDSSSSSSSYFGFEYKDERNNDAVIHPYVEVNNDDDDDDDDMFSSAAFITIEPSPFLQENVCSNLYDFESQHPPPCAWGGFSNDGNDIATRTELQHSIQGAIAHCKGSM